MILEGVRYYRYRICFYLQDGRRRAIVRWSPAAKYLSQEFDREVQNEGIPVLPGSNVIVRRLADTKRWEAFHAAAGR